MTEWEATLSSLECVHCGRRCCWCCEILASRTGTGERSRLYYWRGAPEASLLATVGPSIVPDELRAERAGVIS